MLTIRFFSISEMKTWKFESQSTLLAAVINSLKAEQSSTYFYGTLTVFWFTVFFNAGRFMKRFCMDTICDSESALCL